MTPTMQLRFVVRNDGNGNERRILQQKWEGDIEERWGIDGEIENMFAPKTEWRDVPMGVES